MKKILLALCCFFAVMFSCQDESPAKFDTLDHNQSLIGTWLYMEYGYSPGAGYHTTPVPLEPAQTITFNSSGRMSSNMVSFQQYMYYHIFDDPHSDGHVLAFYKDDPGTEPDLSSSDPTYAMVWNEKKLKLFYRWCFEGCHNGFYKISHADEELYHEEEAGPE